MPNASRAQAARTLSGVQNGAAGRKGVAGANGSTRPALRVISAKELNERSSRRKARIIMGAAMAVVIAGLLMVAGLQAIVASNQIRLDQMNQNLSSAVSTNQSLQLQRAELDAPSRILWIATHRLGMITPLQFTYLPAVDPFDVPVKKS